jgi:hypothetical protein
MTSLECPLAATPASSTNRLRVALNVVLFVFTAWVLGAHYLRNGDPVLVALCVCAPLLFLRRKFWILILLQFLAYGAAGVWIDVAMRLVQARQQAGQAWLAAALILGSVAFVAVLTGALLNWPAITKHYPR